MSRKNPEFFQDEDVVWRVTFYSDDLRTTTVDPTGVVFKIESPSGVINTPTVTDESGVGNFSATYVVDEFGDWNWKWVTDDPRIVIQGTITVLPSLVD